MLYTFGDYVLDTQRHELRHQGVPVPLERKVYQVLVYLVQHADRLVTKHTLLEAVWPDVYVDDSAVARCIRALRQAVGDRRDTQRVIRTMHGQGYRFVATVVEQHVDTVSAPPPPTPPSELARALEPVPPPMATPLRPCGACQHPNTAAAQFCTACGAPLATVCTACGQRVQLPATFCPGCGQRLERSPPPVAPASASSGDIPPAAAALARGERKLVTVVSGMLLPVLGAGLDPEEVQDLLRALEMRLREVMQPYGGTLLHVVSDRLEAVFGAPVAQEDHAVRAVLAALTLRQQWAALANALTLVSALHLGLHTGTVVVEPTGRASPTPFTVVGDVPRVATLLAQEAPPGTLLVSEATARLLRGMVRVETLTPLPVAGYNQPVRVYRVLESQMAPILHGERRQTRFVGREAELATLRLALMRVIQGQGQAVGIMGEPGMGKTRLLDEFQRLLADQPVTMLASSCKSYTQTTPYTPLLALLRQQCRLQETGVPATWAAPLHLHLQELALAVEEWAPYLGHLLGVPEATAQVAGQSPQTLRARTTAALHQVWLHGSRRQPLVLVVENLHWIDASSEAYLTSLVERLAEAEVLLLVTYRPGYVPPWFTTVGMTQLPLGPLSAVDSQHIVQDVWSHHQYQATVPTPFLARAAGNPFFLEELAQAAVTQEGNTTPAPLPDTVQAVLAARLDQLSPDVKRLVQIAAVIGTEVPLALLQPVAGMPEETLNDALGQLQRGAFLYDTYVAPEPVYTFKHVLTQEVAYQSLLKRTRQEVHAHVAHLLVERMPTLTETQPELLARHYTEAGLAAPALDYWQRAGQRALAHSAYAEAIARFTEGLALLDTLPDTPERARQELRLQMALAPALMAARGYTASEVACAYTRALALCQPEADVPQRFVVLRGLRRVYAGRAEMPEAQASGEELLALAQRVQEPAYLVDAHLGLGINAFIVGTLDTAHTHLHTALALYNPQHSRSHAGLAFLDPGMMSLATLSLVLWLRGFPDQAVQRSHEAITLAQQVSHAYSLDFAQIYAIRLRQYRREIQSTQERAEMSLAAAQEAGLMGTMAQGRVYHGWALAMRGHGPEGIAELVQGMAAWRAFGEELNRPYYCALLAEAYQHTGQLEEARRAVAEGLAALHNRHHRNHAAELHRLQGELLVQSGVQPLESRVVDAPSALHHPQAAEAEACLQRALVVARSQQAKSLELRAATSLSRLWQQQGKRTEAYELLAPIYRWFTEGFDTADLQDAKALLQVLCG